MKPFLPYIFLFIAVSLEVIGTTALKASNSFTNLLPTVLTIISYVVGFYVLSLVMRTLPVGITYALWSGLGIILITILSSFVFKEIMDAPAVIGMGFIITGIIIIQLFSKHGHAG